MHACRGGLHRPLVRQDLRVNSTHFKTSRYQDNAGIAPGGPNAMTTFGQSQGPWSRIPRPLPVKTPPPCHLNHEIAVFPQGLHIDHHGRRGIPRRSHGCSQAFRHVREGVILNVHGQSAQSRLSFVVMHSPCRCCSRCPRVTFGGRLLSRLGRALDLERITTLRVLIFDGNPPQPRILSVQVKCEECSCINKSIIQLCIIQLSFIWSSSLMWCSGTEESTVATLYIVHQFFLHTSRFVRSY